MRLNGKLGVIDMATKKKQSAKQIEAGKKYRKLKKDRNVIGGIKEGKWYGFFIADQSRTERKSTFEKMMKNWFGK